jgi:hypothetical protein
MKYGLFVLFALSILPGCSNNSQPKKPEARTENIAQEQAQEQQEMMEMGDVDMTDEQI